jgi:hypothetical protein
MNHGDDIKNERSAYDGESEHSLRTSQETHEPQKEATL